MQSVILSQPAIRQPVDSQDTKLRIGARQTRENLRCRVDRPVVDDDELETFVGLREQRARGHFDVALFIACRDDDRDARLRTASGRYVGERGNGEVRPRQLQQGAERDSRQDRGDNDPQSVHVSVM